MNNYKLRYIFAWATLLAGCQKKIGLQQLPATASYTITQGEDANTFILQNTTPGSIAYFDYGSGTTTNNTDTIHFPFAGNYPIKFTAFVQGGSVQGATDTIKILQNNFLYVNDALWSMLTGGGVGNSRTWYLDLDSLGHCKFFTSPLYYAGSDQTWDNFNPTYVVPSGSWNWWATWKDNTWIADAANYGSMTFSLISAALVTTDQRKITSKGLQNGSFVLDATKHVLTLTNAEILHLPSLDADAGVTWNNVRLLTLTDSTMQLGAVDGSNLDIFNYITKEYYESH